MTLEEKIEEWKLLKKSKKAVEKRIKELRQQIVNELPLSRDLFGVTLQERNLTSYDRDRTWERLDYKGIPARDFTYPEIDESKIEQLYLDGYLTDDDLRYIRSPKYTYALIEKEVEDVQGQADNVR